MNDEKFLELKQLFLEGQEKLAKQEKELEELRRAVNVLSGMLFEMMDNLDEFETISDLGPKFPERTGAQFNS